MYDIKKLKDGSESMEIIASYDTYEEAYNHMIGILYSVKSMGEMVFTGTEYIDNEIDLLKSVSADQETIEKVSEISNHLPCVVNYDYDIVEELEDTGERVSFYYDTNLYYFEY